MAKKRLVWVDIAKGIAIILMVVGHELAANPLRSFIFSFHMPLFFILSGFTSGAVLTWSKWRYKCKKMLKMWLLAVIMVICFEIERLLFWHLSMSQFFLDIGRGIFWGSNIYGENSLTSVGIMWFLFVFVWAKLLFDFLQVIIANKYNGIILGILSYFSYLLSTHHIILMQALDIVPIAAFFMWIGSFLKEEINSNKRNKEKWLPWIITGCFIYWIVCLQNSLNLEMSTRYYPQFLVSLLEAVAGTVVVSYLSSGLSTIKLMNPIRVIGQHTLAVMCIHQLDLYWICWSSLIKSQYFAALARLVLDLAILGILLVIQRIIRERFSRAKEQV